MKILHVINHYQEGFGYQENWLARAQKGFGQDVRVVTSDYYFPFPNYEQTMRMRLGQRRVGAGVFQDDGIEIVRRKSFGAVFNFAGIIFFSVADVIKEFEPDVVHVHGPTNFCLPEIIFFKKKMGYKIFVDCHQDEMVSIDDGSFIKKIYHGLWRIFYHGLGMKKYVSKFLPITEGSRRWLRTRLRIHGDQVVLSPLGVDLDGMFYDEVAAQEFRREHCVGDRLVIVNAGKQYPGKRIEWVIDAFEKALDLGVDGFLVLVGNADKTYDRMLQQKLGPLKGQYLRLPFLRREDLRRVYSASDIGIWPGIPSNTIQESMACGVAVILPDNDIVGQLVDGNGFKESEDAAQAAGFVHKLWNDKDRLIQCQRRSVEIARQYDWRLIAGELMSIYA